MARFRSISSIHAEFACEVDMVSLRPIYVELVVLP